jgi:hypothetical protein
MHSVASAADVERGSIGCDPLLHEVFLYHIHLYRKLDTQVEEPMEGANRLKIAYVSGNR